MSEINPTASEVSPSQVPSGLETIRAGRLEKALIASKNEMLSMLAAPGKPDLLTAFTGVKNNGFGYDTGTLEINDIIAAEAIGLDSRVVLDRTGPDYTRDQSKIAEIDLGDDRLIVSPMNGMLTLNLTPKQGMLKPDKTRSSDAIKGAIKKRIDKSPAHQAIKKLQENVSSTGIPDEVTSEPFDAGQDPLASLSLLQKLGLVGPTYGAVNDLRKGVSPQDVLAQTVANIPAYRAVRAENEDSVTYTWGKGTTRQLTIDQKTGQYTFSARLNPAGHYEETANQAHDIKSIPFIDTECAQSLFAAIEDKGLMFHPGIQLEMMNIKEADRYGSIYTQLTRELAKAINDPNRAKLSNIFVPNNDEFKGMKLLDEAEHMGVYSYERALEGAAGENMESKVRAALNDIQTSHQSESADEIINMVKGVLERDKSGNHDSDIPVTQKEVRIRNGACFDVTAYYLGAAAGTNRRPDWLKSVSENGVEMLEKTNGSHTFLSTQPIKFNGVNLPKGALFAKYDDGWAMLRLTAFAFDKPEDQEASAGSELSKAYVQQRESIIEIGGTALHHLVGKATAAK
jgi:hypothetical protein